MKSTIFLMFLLVTLPIEGNSVKEILFKIPKEHRDDIEKMFCDILLRDSGIYTLFGDKPVSLSGNFTLTPWENIVEKMEYGIECGGFFWKKWETWKKYEHLFHLKKYLIIKNPHINYPWAKSEDVFLINKEAFVRTVKEHLKLFESILGEKIIPNILLKDIEEGRCTLRESIQNNEIILGILLGFGKHNSFLFIKSERDFGFPIYQILDAQLRLVPFKLERFDAIAYPLTIPRSIVCGSDSDHPETKNLKLKYKKFRSKISAIFAKGNFLEITLTQLTSN